MATFYIKHLTQYNYSDTVIDAANQIKLYPIADNFQKLIYQKVTVNTNPFIDTYLDFYNNVVGTFMIIEPHDLLSIESDTEVTTFAKPFPEDTNKPALQWDELKLLRHHINYIDFLKYRPFNGSQDITALIESKDFNKITPYKILQELCDYIYNNFKYTKGITTIQTTLDEIWDLKAGVCQDFTNVMLQMSRMFGIPARYVSGYIFANNEFTRGEGATHAWIEAYIPFYGWLGFDPTNNIIANENHVRLAVGRNYNDCSPVKGVFKGNVDDQLVVKVTVSTSKDTSSINQFTAQTEKSEDVNSYRKNQEIVQQQQQQQ